MGAVQSSMRRRAFINKSGKGLAVMRNGENVSDYVACPSSLICLQSGINVSGTLFQLGNIC